MTREEAYKGGQKLQTYKYIDMNIAIKSALPPRKGKAQNYASNRAAQEIERNLKIAETAVQASFFSEVVYSRAPQ